MYNAMHGLLMLLSLSKLGSAVFDRFNFEYYSGTNMSGFEFCVQLVVLPDPRGWSKRRIHKAADKLLLLATSVASHCEQCLCTDRVRVKHATYRAAAPSELDLCCLLVQRWIFYMFSSAEGYVLIRYMLDCVFERCSSNVR